MKAPHAASIPHELRMQLKGACVVAVGFGAGPGFIGTWQRRCEPPIPLDDALSLLESVHDRTH